MICAMRISVCVWCMHICNMQYAICMCIMYVYYDSVVCSLYLYL